VRESGDGVVFLHRIVEGAADKSYGIHVARLAGIPMTVVERARVILDTLENDHVEPDGQTKIPARKMQRQRRRQLQLFEPEPLPHPVVEKLQGLDIERLTPIEALATLQRLRGEAGEKR
jgi:DNA mismatch repair protein MutS